MKLYPMKITTLSSKSSCRRSLFLLALLCATASFVNADCDNACGDGTYCSSEGFCAMTGSCAILADCSAPDNLFPVAACMGYMECNSGGRCAMNCSGGSDVLGQCDSSEQCSGADEYCASDGVCREAGSCTYVQDCQNMDNIYGIIQCVGTLTCENNSCGKICDGIDGSVSAPTKNTTTMCASSEDCLGADEYCSSDFICRENGSCTYVEDCKNIDNMFDMIECVGTLTCENNFCGKICDGNESSPSPTVTMCARSDDCSDMEYCGSGGNCLEIGNCNLNGDCLNPENSPFPIALCLGSLECQEGACTMNCGEAVPSTEQNTTTLCSSNSGCDAGYCAQGTCLENGRCLSDLDCKNPNHFFADIKCAGYQYCGTDGFCTRDCGVACAPGKRETQCITTGCDTTDISSIPGAISCQADYCNDCEGIFFDAAGFVIEESATVDNANVTGDESSASNSTAEAPFISCTSDDDCLYPVPRQRAEDGSEIQQPMRYCAQGICMEQGSCLSDLDCKNPNHVFADIKCMGYQYCGTDGLCTRDCGVECPPGTGKTQCIATGCDIRNFSSVPGAVSCQSDYCYCKGNFYDAAGFVIDESIIVDNANMTSDEPCTSNSTAEATVYDANDSVDMDSTPQNASEIVAGALKSSGSATVKNLALLSLSSALLLTASLLLVF